MADNIWSLLIDLEAPMRLRQHIFWILIFMAPLGCVSVNFKGDDPEKAENLEVKEPSKPFKEFEALHVDAAWKNPKNGNSISYISECSRESDPSFDSINSGVISDIESAKVVDQKTIGYNKRKAVRSTITGQVDGVSTKFDFVVLKKNSCVFILTYVALEKTYASDIHFYEAFLKGFKVP